MGRHPVHHLCRRVVAGMSDAAKLEHAIQNEIRNALTEECHLFRANVGVGWQGVGRPFKTPHPITVNMNPGDVLLRQARPFDTGLPPGFADTFGWVPVVVSPEMVGQTVAVFIGLEIKSQTGAVRDNQIAFVEAVKRAGGRAGFARSVEDARDIIRGNHARINLQSGAAADRTAVAGEVRQGPQRTAATGAPRRRGGTDRG